MSEETGPPAISPQFWEIEGSIRKSQGSGKKAHIGLELVERALGGGPRPDFLTGRQKVEVMKPRPIYRHLSKSLRISKLKNLCALQ